LIVIIIFGEEYIHEAVYYRTYVMLPYGGTNYTLYGADILPLHKALIILYTWLNYHPAAGTVIPWRLKPTALTLSLYLSDWLQAPRVLPRGVWREDG
jgi:hypothetical protein